MTLVFLSDMSVHHKWLDIIDSSVQNVDEKTHKILHLPTHGLTSTFEFTCTLGHVPNWTQISVKCNI